jgi:UDP-glucose 4-epimerase
LRVRVGIEGDLALKILVTGGAGYVGSACVDLLLSEGYEVVTFDNLSTGHRQAVPSQAILEVGDLGDRARLGEVFGTHRPDAVMHFAASALVGESYENPLKYYTNNLVNGVNLVRVMLEHDVKSIVFSSTCAVYGEPRRIPMEEDDPKDPTNPYGHTKLAFEFVLSDCGNAHGLRSVCLRYFNAAGAVGRLGEDHDPETHLIPNVLKAAGESGSGLKVFGDDYPTEDGTCVRDYVHISDLARAHHEALNILARGESARINLGSGTGFSVLEVIRTAEKVTGVKIPFTVSPRRRGDPAVLVAGSGRARRLLGWEPEFGSLESIVASAWEWHRTHPDGYGA